MSVRDIISSVIFYVGMVLIAFLLVQFGTRYSVQKVHQDFREMEPRVERGSHLVVDKGIRDPDELAYGDIITYRLPPWRRKAYSYEFARVLGKPGDVVEMKNHRLYRAERREGQLAPKEKISEPYVDPRDLPADFSAFVVPRNTVFVMYDKRRRRGSLRDLLIPVRTIHGRMR